MSYAGWWTWSFQDLRERATDSRGRTPGQITYSSAWTINRVRVRSGCVRPRRPFPTSVTIKRSTYPFGSGTVRRRLFDTWSQLGLVPPTPRAPLAPRAIQRLVQCRIASLVDQSRDVRVKFAQLWSAAWPPVRRPRQLAHLVVAIALHHEPIGEAESVYDRDCVVSAMATFLPSLVEPRDSRRGLAYVHIALLRGICTVYSSSKCKETFTEIPRG